MAAAGWALLITALTPWALVVGVLLWQRDLPRDQRLTSIHVHQRIRRERVVSILVASFLSVFILVMGSYRLG